MGDAIEGDIYLLDTQLIQKLFPKLINVTQKKITKFFVVKFKIWHVRQFFLEILHHEAEMEKILVCTIVSYTL